MAKTDTNITGITPDLSLRTLASEYALGAMDKKEYRRIRGELIQRILAGKIIVQDIEFPELMGQGNVNMGNKEVNYERTQIKTDWQDVVELDDGVEVAGRKSPAQFLRSRYMVLGLIVVAVLVWLIFVLVSPSDHETRSPSDVKQKEMFVSPEQAKLSLKGAQLISEFLQRNQWQEEDLKAFVLSWQTLSAEEQQATLNSKRMQRMRNAIHQQFVNAKLASVLNKDKTERSDRQNRIVDFAKDLNIDDSRLTYSK